MVHWLLMGELLHLVQEEGDWEGHRTPRPLLAVPNVTAHPSTANVPITVSLYNGPLLSGFNVPIKGLTFSGPRVGPFGPTYCITLSIPCHLLDSRGEYP